MANAGEAGDSLGIGLAGKRSGRFGEEVQHLPKIIRARLRKNESLSRGRLDIAQDPASLRDRLDELGPAGCHP
jgi:hypothetical protein